GTFCLTLQRHLKTKSSSTSRNINWSCCYEFITEQQIWFTRKLSCKISHWTGNLQLLLPIVDHSTRTLSSFLPVQQFFQPFIQEEKYFHQQRRRRRIQVAQHISVYSEQNMLYSEHECMIQ